LVVSDFEKKNPTITIRIDLGSLIKNSFGDAFKNKLNMVKWQVRDAKGRYTSEAAPSKRSVGIDQLQLKYERMEIKLQIWVVTWLLPYVVAARTHPDNMEEAVAMYNLIKEDMCSTYSNYAFSLRLEKHISKHGYRDMHAAVERLIHKHDCNHGSSSRISCQGIMLDEHDIHQWLEGELNRRPRMIPSGFQNKVGKLLVWCCFLFNTSNRTKVAKLQLSVQWTAGMGYDVFCTQDWAISQQEGGGKQLLGWLTRSPFEFGMSQISTGKGVRALMGPVSLLNGACAQCAQFRGLPSFGRVQDMWLMLKSGRLPTNREILTVWYGVNYRHFENNGGKCFKQGCDFNKLSREDLVYQQHSIRRTNHSSSSSSNSSINRAASTIKTSGSMHHSSLVSNSNK
jgi:hypothetical protein